MIQVSEVSTIASMSALVKTPAGRYEPSDRIWATGAAGPPVAAAAIVAWGSGAVGIVRLQAYPSPRRYGEPGRHPAAAALYLFGVHLIASTGSAFAINGFAGLTGAQILSFWLSFILFNGYVALEVASLAAFYFAARPRSGRPNPAAIRYFIAALL